MSDNQPAKRTILKDKVESRHLPEGERGLRLYLPPGYNEVLSYPVIYCQDGEDFFNFGRIATQAHEMILSGELEPVVIVGVDVDKTVRTEEYAPDGERHDAYVQFFVEEMMPYVASRYAVRSEADQILLAGDSLGATASLHIALRYPGKFKYLLSLSGAYYPASRNIVAALAPGALDWLHAYMLVGLQEDAYETDRGIYDFVALNRSMKRLFEEKGAELVYYERDGKHVWGFWQKEVPAALAWFNKHALT